jgi:prophage maintenance system killer protein
VAALYRQRHQPAVVTGVGSVPPESRVLRGSSARGYPEVSRILCETQRPVVLENDHQDRSPTRSGSFVDLKTLSVEDVLEVYNVLLADFASDDDPISPAGVRSQDLLASAVHRQHTGYGNNLKYPEPIANASSLMYGICNDHPFHNGNKRTALVSLLVHLDRNKLALYNVNQAELYDLVLAVAKHSVSAAMRRSASQGRSTPDAEVAAVAAWVTARARRVKRGERKVTFRKLGEILERFDYRLGERGANKIQVIGRRTQVVLFLKKQVDQVVCTIGYHSDAQFVPLDDVKLIRKVCKLSEEDGVDADSFYDTGEIIGEFVNQYRKVLRRLARD